ncbi:PREDICTED: BAG family molecular chaperone regulator 1-like [Camelina sativa]|uniref:BAG family molecular chaperone regulator 1-like n=1 Tax=Camelina sativa TaxID=90675 RepID=A0ABM0UL27_CAMSA|nr:PREDICTED: BAG family molecular chaperone regulator 1-like [Camelina sativa]XP_010442729.1 PREDICTED: BAG family molecular chaperone regulator 1-like [Camelina sativa]
MMKMMRNKPTNLPAAATATNGGRGSGGGGRESGGHEWEMRPGGMLVQKRNPDLDPVGPPPPPMIRVRIKYGSVYHEISISPQASFGELKKMLSGPTGIHHQDQKLMYKDKERDSKAFLDVSGVKDKSKMVLIEDPISQEKRFLEMRKIAKTEKASKAISDISLDVDRLGGRVSAFEMVIKKGGKIAEKDLVTVIELLMNELIKLDGIVAEGDVKLQRKMQVKRVQNYVETLDVLKVKNSIANGQQKQSGAPKRLAPIQEHNNEEKQEQKPVQSLMDMPIQYKEKKQEIQEEPRDSGSAPFVVEDSSTKWETFDHHPSTPLSSTTANNHTVPPRFNWEFFD